MSELSIIYSLDEIKDLSDAELYNLLYISWEIENKRIEAWGSIRVKNNGIAWLHEAKSTIDNRVLSYPYQAEFDIIDGIYIDSNYAKKLLNGRAEILVRCTLVLCPLHVRQKHINPFRLMVKENSAEILSAIPWIDKNSILNDKASSFISESIYNFHYKQVTQKLFDEKNRLESEINKAKENRKLIDEDLLETEAKKKAIEAQTTHLVENIEASQLKLKLLKEKYQNEEDEMSRKIEKLKSYISEKATFLKEFEFIDEQDFDEYFTNSNSKTEKPETMSFSNVLNGNYKQAVSYIQAHLRDLDILYPRHIIENYLTLIRSNDLIILAGDSGSGKTNLVNSFAKAIGGVSKIIPVKPNWTSSEDLLGYYNPLEKKYLATPFLEALIEAVQNPDVPYFICLDEMNLARIEYYFADFLSKLETRDSTPEIQLYSDDESAHVLSELKAVVSIITSAKDKFSKEGIVDFVKLMQDESINAEMKRAFGFSDKDSLIKYHGDIRRMLAGVMGTPSTIKIPPNVRIIGAINIDETTHYLSPKILDRAHIMKFSSPLLADWDSIFSEIEGYGFENVDLPLHFEIDALGVRSDYPKYERENDFCQLFVKLNKEFFSPLGVEFGMRTIRQGLQYIQIFSDTNEDRELAINNFILHKVLPKFTFDGTKKSGNYNKLDLIDKVLVSRLEEVVKKHESISEEFSCVAALKNIIENAKTNDGIVNYWA